MKKFTIGLFLLIFLLVATGCKLMRDGAKKSLATGSPPNIIFLIGDGMGVPQISTAYYFGDGEANFSRFKHIGFHQSSDLTHKITDSAAGATAFSIGQKTFKRAIGVSGDSIPQETIMEYLQKEGYKTGLISLTTITHATPAAFYAHVVDRDMHEEIASQLVDARVDFIAGGGRKYFETREDGRNLFSQLIEMGYKLDTTQISEPNYESPNAYLLVDESMPSKIEGRGDFLPKATDYALDYFNRMGEPFFLMVEGSYIDWSGHAKNAEMLVEEVEDFDQTLGVALDFVDKNPNTLLIVTADHETGGVSISKKYLEQKIFGQRKEIPGEVEITFNSNQHSGELIPVFAYGLGADKFQGIYENKDIFHKIMSVYNRE